MSETSGARHFTSEELAGRLPLVDGAPAAEGTLELVVRRPREGERELLDVGELDLVEGLLGDRWARGRHGRPADLEAQVTLMSARAAELVAGPRERWPLAGDQLYVDLDLGLANLPPGTRLEIGSAVVELSAQPHTGCKKFVERFGLAAMLLVNSPEGRELRLRGANARVVRAGLVRPGDAVRKVEP